jgi:hypothetical protein
MDVYELFGEFLVLTAARANCEMLRIIQLSEAK